jgi:hypothetical protein
MTSRTTTAASAAHVKVGTSTLLRPGPAQGLVHERWDVPLAGVGWVSSLDIIGPHQPD